MRTEILLEIPNRMRTAHSGRSHTIVQKKRYDPVGTDRGLPMAKIIEDLHSPEWWFSIVFVAIIVALIAPLIPNLFVVLLTRQRATNYVLRLHGLLTAAGILALMYELIARAPNTMPWATLIVALAIVALPGIVILYDMLAKSRTPDFILTALIGFVFTYFFFGGFPSSLIGWFVRYGATSFVCWIEIRIIWWCTGGVRRWLVAKVTGQTAP